MTEHVEGRIEDKLDSDEDTFTEEEQEKYQQYLIEKNEELGREFKTIEEGVDALAAIPIEDLEGYNSLETLKEAGILDILKENGIERPTLNDIAESLGISPQQGLDMSKYIQYCIENGYSYQNVLGGAALEASYYDSTLSSLPRLSMEDYINKTNLGEEEANRLESLQTSVNIRQTGQQIVEVGGAIIGLTGGNVDTDIADFDKVDDIAKLADDVQDVGKLVDDVSVTSDLDEINKVAKYGDEFGKMGKYVENPDIKVDWDTFARHASERMKKRGITKDMVESWVQNGKALSQNGGDKFAFISQEGVAIVSKEGKLVTAWGIDNFDDAMKTTVEQLYRK